MGCTVKAIRCSRYGPPEVLEVAKAMDYLEQGHARGKVVITM
jgi:hypothetical protein